MNTGNKILELRKKNNMSQEVLAEKVGVTRQTISKWELGETSPSLKEAKKICKIFNVSLDTLINNKIDNKKSNKSNIIKLLTITILIFIAILLRIHSFNYSKYKDLNNYEHIFFKDIIVIKHNTIDNLLEYKGLKIRNDFKNYEKIDNGGLILKSDNEQLHITLKDIHDDLGTIYINSQVDRDFFDSFLKKNNIKNGLDLLKYSMYHEYNINFFTSINKMKANSIMLNTIKFYFGIDSSLNYDTYLISGDYSGIIRITDISNGYIINLIKDDREYYITFKTSKDLNYIKNLLSSIEI